MLSVIILRLEAKYSKMKTKNEELKRQIEDARADSERKRTLIANIEFVFYHQFTRVS